MAHHNSTPKSILDAPAPTFGFVVEHSYPNRAERRHAWTREGKRLNVPKSKQAPAMNDPYRKPLLANAAG